jgi:IMP dehydrogenase
MRESVCFDDVLLVPQMSDIKSRTSVDLSVDLGSDTSLGIPFISAPMDTVTGHRMATAMAAVGGLGVIHRYNSIDEQVHLLQKSHCNAAAAIGITGDFLERAFALIHADCKILCIDVAHGHHISVKSALETLRSKLGDTVSIMAGNVATLQGFNDLSDWGADIIRVGVGGGSICSTRLQTGHGVPTLQSVIDCAKSNRDALIIADGGIKNSGDMSKALAAGADLVMVGRLLAGTDEAPGDTVQVNGKKCKVYRGMASPEAQVAWRGEYRSNEGVSRTVPFKGSVEDILSELERGVRSALSYSGARNLQEFRAKACFIKQSPLGRIESGTHIDI